MTADDPGLAALQAEADALCRDPRLRALLQAHWPEFSAQAGSRLQLAIHPADQMLLHSLRHHRDANAAVSQYYNVALQQYQAARQILDTVLPPAAGRVALLDFACGFGRLLRFLSACGRDLHLSASEIQDDALQYVAASFDAEPLPSSMRPEDFQPGRRFDFIWVASLFSHLPEGLFHRWLKQLLGLLTPRGVLCFSVHDEVLAPRDEPLPAQGLLFRPQSENAALDAEAYGTTYVSEAFVRSAIARATGDGRQPHRIRKALAHEQDIYVVAADPQRDLSALAAFRRGPWGWADERRVVGERLVLDGWAASIDDGALPAVTVRVDGATHTCATGRRRADVRDAFADDRLLDAGWRFELELPPEGRQPWVEVLAPTARGECALLYAGWPGGRPTTPSGHVYRREIDMAQRSSLSVLASLVPAGARVLDLGTGSGALGRLLRTQRGCSVDGVTISEAEREAARDGYDRIERLDLEQPGWEARFAPGDYDCIVCADVLEHLREPERVLQACQRLLRPDGWLLASVPNVAYAGMVLELMHGDWTYGPEGLLDRTHLRFFTRRSFERLLHAEGWQVQRVEPIELTWYYTEFWTPFDHLPPAVARYLLAQPDASAYQLVFAAQRPGATAAASAPASVPPADPAVHVAVFASTLVLSGQNGASRRLAALGRVGRSPQTLAFDIPGDALAAMATTADVAPMADAAPAAGLYWQPADRPGYLHLYALRLLDAGGQPVAQWQAQSAGAAALLRAAHRQQVEVGDAAAEAGAPLRLLLTGNEPGITLPLALPPGVAVANGASWRLEIDCGWPLSADYLALRDALGPGVRLPRDETVEIVVPVYGGLPHVRRCLTSVLGSLGQRPWHLTVIDDASPDPAVGAWLRQLAALHPGVSVLTNARNLGFVATVNLGMRLAGRRDVVLLNSDTEVSGDWLDRLRAAAWRDARTGTVTPFSNNATICSFPRFCEANELPSGHNVATLQALFARTLDGQSVDIPTAVGFCMYIRRDCLDDVGEFDAATFGAGYGEENDFCLRASARGWRHLHALDVFVYHAGGASFSDRQQTLQAQALAAMRRLHPQYEAIVQDFVARDPAQRDRQRVMAQLGELAAVER